jgi:hypothetical protein
MRNEADVKKQVKKVLAKCGEELWYFMPPANGYGRSGIPDFLGTYKGMTFAIETKFGNNKPTNNQEREMNNLSYCGAKVWLVSERNIHVWEDEFAGWAALCS